MKCPKCKRARLRQQLSVFVECDAECYTLNKKGIRKSDVRIMGAGWQHASVYCPKCGHFSVINGKATPAAGGRFDARRDSG